MWAGVALATACLAGGVPTGAAGPPSADVVELVEREMERLHLPGVAVAVIENGSLAWARGFGFADLAGTTRVEPSTRFPIGSISKIFLGVVALQLAERGALNLDDAVTRHLPELGEAYAGVTLRHLLTHTAGVRRDGKRAGPPPYLNHQVYGDQLPELLAASAPEFPPGSGAAYSNLGPALVAMVIERSTGTPIDEHAAKAVFGPAGMDRTLHLRPGSDPDAVDGMAAGTVWTGSRTRPSGHESRYPTGSVVSTVLDLAAFVEALESGRLLGEEAREAMWRPHQLEDGRAADLGRDAAGRQYLATLGWFAHRLDGRDVVHHGGSTEGFSSQIDIDRGSGRTVIVLANNEAGPAANLAWAIHGLLREGPWEDPASARLEEVPVDSGRWRIEAAHGVVEEHLGRTALHLRDGVAWVEDLELTDGVVQVDVAFTDERGFLGLLWRLQDAGNYEQFYVRPHQSGNPDANQYTPSFDGLTSWQLYHGPGYGAPIEYRFDDWNTIRVVVAGDRAEVYVNDLRRPALFIADLKRAASAGAVGLSAFAAPARFSAFGVARGSPPSFRSTVPEAQPPSPGTITQWGVSDAFDWAVVEGAVELPPALAAQRSWSLIGSEPTGLVNLGAVNARRSGADAVFGRVTLESPVGQTARLRFGYSDRVRVYLNGRALYAGDNSYRSRDYRYLGTIGDFDELLLPLEAGENELWFAVGEDFGGWGLKAVLEADGVTVSPGAG